MIYLAIKSREQNDGANFLDIVVAEGVYTTVEAALKHVFSGNFSSEMQVWQERRSGKSELVGHLDMQTGKLMQIERERKAQYQRRKELVR